MIRVLVCRVGRAPAVETIAKVGGTCLDDLQRICGGLVDCVALPDGCDVWRNDDFLMREIDLPLNRTLEIYGMPLPVLGDFVIARVDNRDGATISVTDEDVAKYTAAFEAEDIAAAQAMNAIRSELA